MKDKLVKLLKQIDANISDEHIDELAEMFEAKIASANKTGYTKGIAKTQEIDADYATKLDEAIEKFKADYELKLEGMDAEHASKLEDILEAIDSDHTEKLEKLVEAIDEDHTSKLENLVEAIDEDHTAKLEHIVESYETHYEKMISEKVDDFISTYIRESMPEEQIVEAVKLEKLQSAISEIRQILFVNDDYVQTEIKEAIISAKGEIDGEKDKVNRLMIENMDLKKKMMLNEATQLLEQKTASMKPALASFVKNYFDKVYDVKKISEKLDEAVKAFSSEEDEEKKELVEEKERGAKPIDMPEENVVDETKLKQISESTDIMDVYVNKARRSKSPQRNY